MPAPISFIMTHFKPDALSGLLAWYSPEEEGAAVSASTLTNLANGLSEGTVTSPGVVLVGDQGIKEVDFGLNGRVAFGNRYKPTGGVTILTIMKNIDLATDLIQFHGGMGITGDEGYVLLMNGGNTIGFRANIGNNSLNQITSNGIYVLNKWQMIAGTYDGITSRIYRDLQLRTNGGNTYTGNISYNGITTGFWATLQGQTATTGRYWNGSGRVYLIYNRSLSHNEIIGIYNYYRLKGFCK